MAVELPLIEPLLAHGVGVRGDLPLPLWAVAYGSAGVLVVTFGLLLRTRHEPRLETAGPGPAGPGVLDRALRVLTVPARLLGLVVLGVVIATGLTGPEAALGNPAPFALYVGAWVGGMLANAVLGDVWRAVNPYETIARAVAPLRERPPAWLERLGVWPAAAALLGFVWLELVHPTPSDPRVVGAALLAFTTAVVLGALWWGPRWARAVDPFGRLFELVAAMAPLHRDRDGDGRLRLRPPLVGLADVTPQRGTTALVLVALGSTSFDGLSGTSLWEGVAGEAGGWAAVPVATVGLLGMIALVTVLYLWGANGVARELDDLGPGAAADRFVHTLVPIVLGYAVAHYFSLLVFEGQRLLSLASDPFGTGADLFGTAAWSIDFTAVSPLTIAVVQVSAIVGGHVAAVVLAHDRALALAPPADTGAADAPTASRSQYQLLVAMVSYTIGALFLLLGA